MLSPLAQSCWRKKGYRTSRYAQKQIRKIYKQEHLQLYKYRCSSCGQYHLTKKLSAKGQVI